MRILHISNFGDRHNGRLYWNQCYKISNGFIRNGHNVYNFSERDKSRSHWLNKLSNNKNLQESVLQTVRNYNPDIVLLGHADRIHLETIEKRLNVTSNIKKILENLQLIYKKRGINLVCIRNKWSFRTADDLSKLMSLQKSTQKKLSKATIETLSIIVYHQPVTRTEIEEIRGVSFASNTLEILME